MSSTTDIYTVYQIKNLINSKVYIGITTRDPEERWNDHLYSYPNTDFVLYKAMRKYGLDNFQFSILQQTNDLEVLKNLEIKYIQEYNSYCFQEDSNGYNMTLGGDGTVGYKPSEETRIKISNALMGAKNPNYGKPKSADVKRKISEAHKGKTLSEETKKKLSEANMGSSGYWKGKTLSEETKKKLSEANMGSSGYWKGKTLSKDHREKIRLAIMGKNNPNYGKPKSVDTKRKMSDSQKGRILTEEHKEKLREASIRYWKNKKAGS